MRHLARRQAVLLAVLLDADGLLVPYAALGAAVGSAGVADSRVVRQYVQRLAARGVDCVEVVAGAGCRLAALPPDWTLEEVLAMLDALRRGHCEAPLVIWRKAA